jgi:DNA-binding NtrC family response regulator
VPPLRDRPEDIMPLARSILAAKAGEGAVAIGDDARHRLLGYGWPGNVRELKNVLERALILRSGAILAASDIRLDGDTRDTRDTPAESQSVMRAASSSSSKWLAVDASAATRDEVEREHIRMALAAENGRVEAAARRLGMPRSTLYQRLKVYGITATRARAGQGAPAEETPEEGEDGDAGHS